MNIYENPIFARLNHNGRSVDFPPDFPIETRGGGFLQHSKDIDGKPILRTIEARHFERDGVIDTAIVENVKRIDLPYVQKLKIPNPLEPGVIDVELVIEAGHSTVRTHIDNA